MRLVGWSLRQELWRFVNYDVIHVALHGAKQVMVNVRDVDGLVDDQMEHPPSQGVSICHHPTYSWVNPSPEGFVIAYHGNWSVVVEGYQGVPT